MTLKNEENGKEKTQLEINYSENKDHSVCFVNQISKVVSAWFDILNIIQMATV